MMRLDVVVPGEVVPTARVRVLHGRASTPRRTVEYQATLARAVRTAIAEQGWPEGHDRPCEVIVHAYGVTRGDADNMAKGALDALVRAKALRDDSVRVVRELHVYTTEAGSPMLTIGVRSC